MLRSVYHAVPRASAFALIAASLPAGAQTVTAGIYGGGDAGVTAVVAQAMACLTGDLPTASCPGVPSASLGILAGTSVTLAEIGAGSALANFAQASNHGEGSIDLSALSTALVNGAPSAAIGPSSVFPTWDFALSDAPLDAVDPATGANYHSDYNLVAKNYRGIPWNLPVAGSAVLFGYNLPAFDASSNPTGALFANYATVGNVLGAPIAGTTMTYEGETSKLQLSRDAVCYIYTGLDHSGAAVGESVWVEDTPGPGSSASGHWAEAPALSVTSHSWNAWVFTQYNLVNKVATPLYLGPLSGASANAIDLDYDNAVAGGTSQIVNAAGYPLATAPTVTPLLRSDAAGTTYVLTLWLAHNCVGFTTAKPSTDPVTGAAITQDLIDYPNTGNWWNAVSTQPTTPSWVAVTAAGADQMQAQVATGAVGTIGYATPSASGFQPQNAAGLPTAYVQNYSSKNQFVAPTTQAIINAYTQRGAPVPSYYSLGVNKGLSGTVAGQWGGLLNDNIFNPKVGGPTAYAIGGLTYMIGYQCYPHDAGNDRAGFILTFLQHLYAGDFNQIMRASGLTPLDYDFRINGKGNTLNEAAYNVVSNGVELTAYTKSALLNPPSALTYPNSLSAIQQILLTDSFGSAGISGSGPYPCRFFTTDANH